MSAILPTLGTCLHAQASVRGTQTNSPSSSLILPRMRSKRAMPIPIRAKILPPWHLGSSEERKEAGQERSDCPQSSAARLLRMPRLQGGSVTAEIAIINRTAVTLAADSAMTISGVDKIYNTADKIFELSMHNPIGLMVYNTLDFMGVPLDVAIKEFRNSSLCVSCDSVLDAAELFFRFLADEIGAESELQRRFVERLASLYYAVLRGESVEKLEETIVANPKGPPRGFDPHRLLIELIMEFVGPLRKLKPAQCFAEMDIREILDRYSDVLDQTWTRYIANLPVEITDDDKDLLREFIALILHRDVFTSTHTGVVFAGFGSREFFPCLYQFEIEGIIADKLKRRIKQNICIDRSGSIAEIVPFAQHDMANRFLYGIDPEFEQDIPDYLESALKKTGSAIIGGLGRSSRARRADLAAKLDSSIALAIREFKEDAIRTIKENYKRQITDMVSFMPKQELASFAESLVNITSIKRRVTAELETVGGPVDVAIISKSDGFVWVKRKHYFDPSLNPRYFYRKYGMIPPGMAGGRQ
jgi:hypothetical protein